MSLTCRDIKILKDRYYNLSIKEAKKIIVQQPQPVEKDEHDIEIERLKKKAERTMAIAANLKAQNQIKKARIESDNIDKQSKQEEPIYPAPVQQQQAPQEIKTKELDVDECITSDLPSSEISNLESLINEVDENEEPTPEVKEQPKENNPPSEGQTPQTKEEAEIAKTQAETEKIKAEAEAAKGKTDEGGFTGTEEVSGTPAAGDPNAMSGMPPGSDPNAMAMGGMGAMPGMPDPNDPLGGFGETSAAGAGGMGGFGAPPKTTTTLGRLYLIKKLYYKLSAINHILVNNTDPKLTELSKTVSEGFDLFKLVVNNLKSYKDKIDDIIVMFYEFIKAICEHLDNYYKDKSNLEG